MDSYKDYYPADVVMEANGIASVTIQVPYGLQPPSVSVSSEGSKMFIKARVTPPASGWIANSNPAISTRFVVPLDGSAYLSPQQSSSTGSAVPVVQPVRPITPQPPALPPRVSSSQPRGGSARHILPTPGGLTVSLSQSAPQYNRGMARGRARPRAMATSVWSANTVVRKRPATETGVQPPKKRQQTPTTQTAAEAAVAQASQVNVPAPAAKSSSVPPKSSVAPDSVAAASDPPMTAAERNKRRLSEKRKRNRARKAQTPQGRTYRVVKNLVWKKQAILKLKSELPAHLDASHKAAFMAFLIDAAETVDRLITLRKQRHEEAKNLMYQEALDLGRKHLYFLIPSLKYLPTSIKCVALPIQEKEFWQTIDPAVLEEVEIEVTPPSTSSDSQQTRQTCATEKEAWSHPLSYFEIPSQSIFGVHNQWTVIQQSEARILQWVKKCAEIVPASIPEIMQPRYVSSLKAYFMLLKKLSSSRSNVKFSVSQQRLAEYMGTWVRQYEDVVTLFFMAYPHFMFVTPQQRRFLFDEPAHQLSEVVYYMMLTSIMNVCHSKYVYRVRPTLELTRTQLMALYDKDLANAGWPAESDPYLSQPMTRYNFSQKVCGKPMEPLPVVMEKDDSVIVIPQRDTVDVDQSPKKAVQVEITEALQEGDEAPRAFTPPGSPEPEPEVVIPPTKKYVEGLAKAKQAQKTLARDLVVNRADLILKAYEKKPCVIYNGIIYHLALFNEIFERRPQSSSQVRDLTVVKEVLRDKQIPLIRTLVKKKQTFPEHLQLRSWPEMTRISQITQIKQSQEVEDDGSSIASDSPEHGEVPAPPPVVTQKQDEKQVLTQKQTEWCNQMVKKARQQQEEGGKVESERTLKHKEAVEELWKRAEQRRQKEEQKKQEEERRKAKEEEEEERERLAKEKRRQRKKLERMRKTPELMQEPESTESEVSVQLQIDENPDLDETVKGSSRASSRTSSDLKDSLIDYEVDWQSAVGMSREEWQRSTAEKNPLVEVPDRFLIQRVSEVRAAFTRAELIELRRYLEQQKQIWRELGGKEALHTEADDMLRLIDDADKRHLWENEIKIMKAIRDMRIAKSYVHADEAEEGEYENLPETKRTRSTRRNTRRKQESSKKQPKKSEKVLSSTPITEQHEVIVIDDNNNQKSTAKDANNNEIQRESETLNTNDNNAEAKKLGYFVPAEMMPQTTKSTEVQVDKVEEQCEVAVQASTAQSSQSSQVSNDSDFTLTYKPDVAVDDLVEGGNVNTARDVTMHSVNTTTTELRSALAHVELKDDSVLTLSSQESVAPCSDGDQVAQCSEGDSVA